MTAADDIVHRLRDATDGWSGDAVCVDGETAADAAIEIKRLRAAINDALALLADTDLHSEDRAANAQTCLARALTGGSQETAA